MKPSRDAEVPVETNRDSSDLAEREASTVLCSGARLRLLAVGQPPRFTSSLARWVHGHEPRWVVEATTAEQAVEAILAGAHDVVALDWNLGATATGADLCRKARAGGSSTALVVLTTHNSIEHRIRALEAGANDYLVKGTMHAHELMTRLEVATIRARAERTRSPRRPVVATIGPLTVHLETESVVALGNLLDLPRHQRRLLVRLAQTAGKVVSREELCAAARMAPGPAFKNLHNEILRLRRHLGPAAASRVETVRASGYRLS